MKYNLSAQIGRGWGEGGRAEERGAGGGGAEGWAGKGAEMGRQRATARAREGDGSRDRHGTIQKRREGNGRRGRRVGRGKTQSSLQRHDCKQFSLSHTHTHPAPAGAAARLLPRSSCVDVCTHTCVCVCVRARACVRVCVRARVCVCIRAYMYRSELFLNRSLAFGLLPPPLALSLSISVSRPFGPDGAARLLQLDGYDII